MLGPHVINAPDRTRTSRVGQQAPAGADRLAALEVELARLRTLEVDRGQLKRVAERMATALQTLQALAGELMHLVDPSAERAPSGASVAAVAPASSAGAPARETRSQRLKTLSMEPRPLRAGAMRMLAALATFHPGVMTRPQIARAAGLRVTSGTFSTYWSELRQKEFLEEASAGLYRATERGLNALGSARPTMPRTFAERRAFWEARLRAGSVVCSSSSLLRATQVFVERNSRPALR